VRRGMLNAAWTALHRTCTRADRGR
jgi:hypothetical protein